MPKKEGKGRRNQENGKRTLFFHSSKNWPKTASSGITRCLRGRLQAPGWKLFGPLSVTMPRLWEFLYRVTFSPSTSLLFSFSASVFCFYCYRRQKGFREVAWVFVGLHLRNRVFFCVGRKPPRYPRRFSLVPACQAFSSPSFSSDFLFLRRRETKEQRFSYPWVAKGIRNWPSTRAY